MLAEASTRGDVAIQVRSADDAVAEATKSPYPMSFATIRIMMGRLAPIA